ncbi:MAG: hypothetical protein WCS43_15260 [Verrucomicrobiota bacterium]
MTILEWTCISEKTQRSKDEIEVMENTLLTLDSAKKSVAIQKMLEEATNEGLKGITIRKRVDMAIKAQPNYEKAKQRLDELKRQVETEELRQSRRRVAELMKQATKWYAQQVPNK